MSCPGLDAVRERAVSELEDLGTAGRNDDVERIAAVIVRLCRGCDALESYDLLDLLERPAISPQDVRAMASDVGDIVESFEVRLLDGEDWSEIEKDADHLRRSMARDIRHLSRAGRFDDVAIHASTLNDVLARVRQLRPRTAVH